MLSLKPSFAPARATRVASHFLASKDVSTSYARHTLSTISVTSEPLQKRSASSRIRQLSSISRRYSTKVSWTSEVIEIDDKAGEHDRGVPTRTEKEEEIEDEDGPTWKNLGISEDIIAQLRKHFPHIEAPTPAQTLFLLSVLGGREVFLKDSMGRGKTLAIAVAALQLLKKAKITGKDKGKGPKIIIIDPSPHLAYQIFDLLQKLSPQTSSSTSAYPLVSLLNPGLAGKHEESPRYPLPDSPIVVSTAKNMLQFNLDAPRLTHLFLDEPDTMTGPVPSRNSSTRDPKSHPIIRHPPPIVEIMTSFLNISINYYGLLDFGQRRDAINTIWTSATMGRDFKRFIKTRGWIRRGNAWVDLDFTENASVGRKEFRQKLLKAIGLDDSTEQGRHKQREPEHHVLLVDRITGNISPLELTTSSTRIDEDLPKLHPYILEAFALLCSTSPPPPGKHTLALAPEGVSINQMGKDLGELGIGTSILTPEVLQLGIPSVAEDTQAPVLLSARSSVPGLHLEDLHAVYLLNGLDVSSLTPSQRKNQGIISRITFYDTVSGRLGRLGTDASSALPLEYQDRQKIVSIVMEGSIEQAYLQRLFSPTSRSSASASSEDDELLKKRKLWKWDMQMMNEVLEGGHQEEAEPGIQDQAEKASE